MYKHLEINLCKIKTVLFATIWHDSETSLSFKTITKRLNSLLRIKSVNSLNKCYKNINKYL